MSERTLQIPPFFWHTNYSAVNPCVVWSINFRMIAKCSLKGLSILDVRFRQVTSLEFILGSIVRGVRDRREGRVGRDHRGVWGGVVFVAFIRSQYAVSKLFHRCGTIQLLVLVAWYKHYLLYVFGLLCNDFSVLYLSCLGGGHTGSLWSVVSHLHVGIFVHPVRC